MKDSLPTLKGLRAFEEAYQRGSYSAAAAALNVQQPAISYQIKQLETDLGVTLFRKENGRLVPTPPAQSLFKTVTRSFAALRETSKRLRAEAATPPVTIATYPGIATYWLSSRLPVLSSAAGTPVKVVTLAADTDILREDCDCRILFGEGNWPGMDAHMVMPERVCPVAAPDLAKEVFKGPQDGLAEGVTVIEQEDAGSRWLGWDDWQRQADCHIPASAERLKVNDHGLALHLALSGAGIALGWLGVVEELLAAGTLVRLSNKVAVSQSGYWLVARPGFFDTMAGQALQKVLIA